MRVIGIGIDLIDLDHFRIHYSEEDPDLLDRCFTGQELSQVESGPSRLASLAARFALKEATFKALGGGEEIALTDIETVRAKSGGLDVRFHRRATHLARELAVSRVLVSVTHSSSAAAAVAVAVCD